MVRVIKKDNTKEAFNIQKVVIAVNKSANRVLYTFTEDELRAICDHVEGYIRDHGMTEVQIWQMHNIVEAALEAVRPEVAKSYRDYRNYKQDFVGMLDSVYKKSQSIMYIGDKENSNTDSALVSTKRSLIFNQLNKELYQKFFMNTEELQACRDGYIYVHDMSARRDTMNCCLFDVEHVLKGGFEMGNLWYNEPKTLNVAFDVIGDIVLSAASQQYGGFTVPSVDLLLEPYAERSYKMLTEKYSRLGLDAETVEKEVMADILNDFRAGLSGLGVQVQHGRVQPRRLSVHHHDHGHRHGALCQARVHYDAERPSQGAGQEGPEKARAVPQDRVPVRREPARPGQGAGGRVRGGHRVLVQGDVSGLAEPDRRGLCAVDVQEVWRDHQPDGLPRVPVSVVRARRDEACG